MEGASIIVDGAGKEDRKKLAPIAIKESAQLKAFALILDGHVQSVYGESGGMRLSPEIQAARICNSFSSTSSSVHTRRGVGRRLPQQERTRSKS